MQSLHSPRRVGVLVFWHLSENGGFGKVFLPSTKELFFLHRKLILTGLPLPGSTVTFTPIPPSPGKILRQASEAVIDNTRLVRTLKVNSFELGGAL
jgi:hypothetical protein